MKNLFKILSVALLSFCALNMSAADKEQKTDPKNNFKLYGFIRNYFIFDSRESVSGTGPKEDPFKIVPANAAE